MYRAGHRNVGSKIMRCDQLCAIARRYLGERYEFSLVSPPPPRNPARQVRFARQCRGAVVILLKHVERVLVGDAIAELRAGARAICVDYVDSPPTAAFAPLVDVHIAASRAGLEMLRERLSGDGYAPRPGAEIRLVTHHADPRIRPRPQPDCGELRLLYLGNPDNTYIPAAAAADVALAGYGRDDNFASALAAAAGYNMHYCIRRRPHSAPKPFTKGFNAAAFDRNLLVNRQVDDAEHYLGADYPFFVDSLKPQAIADGIAKAKSLVGSPEWQRGLGAVREMRKRCAPARVAAELGDILAMF
ncbi:MAG: hypothetical protein ACE5FS_05425 [Paracoccaceae bacterium]